MKVIRVWRNEEQIMIQTYIVYDQYTLSITHTHTHIHTSTYAYKPINRNASFAVLGLVDR